MIEKHLAEEVLALATSTGGDFGEIYMEDTVAHGVSMRSSAVEQVNSTRKHGAGIRAFSGKKSIYAYTNDTSRDGLISCARQVAAAIAEGTGTKQIPFHETHWGREESILLPPSKVKTSRKVEKLRFADASARGISNEIVQVSVSFSDQEKNILVANTEGVFSTDHRVYSRFVVSAIASDGKDNQTGSETPGCTMGFEIFDHVINPQQLGISAAQVALTMLHAPFCPKGVMPVVLDGGFGGVIFHEACGHSLEATSVAFGNSEFAGKLGLQIASPIVTAVDDGTMDGAWGSIPIDDEGIPTSKLTLIENGILKNYMIDRLGGRRMNMPSTGSGRRQDYTFAPTSRMRNTYIAPGKDHEDEIIRSMGEGLYAKKLGGGSVNPATGEFNFSVMEGYMVKDGKVAYPVRGASLIGKGSEVLIKIERVGDESTLALAAGMCGSLSGQVPVTVGQPMIRVSSMTVGGR